MSALARFVAVTGILLGILVLPQPLAHAADDTPDDGSNLTVTVTGGGSSGGGATGSATTGGGSVGAGQNAAPGSDAVSIGGMIYLSGVNSSVALSPDPGSGDVTLWLSVRNASTSVVDLTADFWMESVLFGVGLDESRGVPVTALQPGETRLLSARLHGVGQWGLVNTHVRITPPPVVDGTPLTPTTRDALVVVFPWFAVLMAALVAIGLLTWRAVVLALAAAPAPAPTPAAETVA